MPLSAAVCAELEAVVGAAHVITEPEQLRVYDCDGLTGLARDAGARRPARLDGRGAGGRPHLRARGRAVRRRAAPAPASPAARCRSADGDRDLARPHEPRSSRSTSPTQRVVVEPGVTNLDVTQAVAADGFFYAPDPVEPAGLHDRRQRRRELGRRALPEVRLHDQPRLGRRRSCCPTASSSSSAARRSSRTAPTCSACSSAPRARSGS